MIVKFLSCFFIAIQLCAASWSAPMLIDLSARAARQLVLSSYDSTRGRIMATWNDFVSNNPTYSIFDGASWTVPLPIELSVARGNVFSSYNTALDRTVATWVDDLTGEPVYATYDGTSWVPSAPIVMTQSRSDTVLTSPFLASLFNQTVAIWLDLGDIPFISTYNGTSWSAPVEVGMGEYANAFANSFDPVRMQTLATWRDLETSTPFFTIFDGMSWSTPAMIQNTPVSSQTVLSVFDSTSGQSFAAWLDPMAALEYSIYDGAMWGPVLPLGGIGLGNAYLTYYTVGNQIVATWIGSIQRPFYAIYTP
jgi:hypothetical protein